MSLSLTKPTAKDEVDFMRNEAFKERKALTIALEGKDDANFWTFVFDRSALKGNYKIFKSYNYPTDDSSGKYTLAHFLPHTQADFALCIDSDYDYLLENLVWQCPFVFQTYTYSIENYYCYVPRLKAVINRAVNLPLDTEGVSFEDIFVRQFSESIYELMLQSLQESINDGRSEDARRQLGRNIRLVFKPSISEMLSNLKAHTQKHIQHLNITEAFRKELANKGLTPETAYLFARGHDVFDGVFMPILKLIQKEIKNKHLDELKTITDKQQSKVAEQAYRMGIKAVKNCLLENVDFADCFLFQKIEKDIQRTFN